LQPPPCDAVVRLPQVTILFIGLSDRWERPNTPGKAARFERSA